MILPCGLSQSQAKQLLLLTKHSLVSSTSEALPCVQYVAWAELLIIQMYAPNASFAGHLCGILAGERPPRSPPFLLRAPGHPPGSSQANWFTSQASADGGRCRLGELMRLADACLAPTSRQQGRMYLQGMHYG